MYSLRGQVAINRLYLYLLTLSQGNTCQHCVSLTGDMTERHAAFSMRMIIGTSGLYKAMQAGLSIFGARTVKKNALALVSNVIL